MTYFLSLTPMLPELLLTLWAIIMLMLGAYKVRTTDRQIGMLSLVGLIFAVASMMWLPVEQSLFEGFFVTDGFTRIMKWLTLLGAILTLTMAFSYYDDQEPMKFEYPVLILFSVIGMMLMLSSGDFITLYLGLELMSLSLYVLAAFRREDVKSSEAGLKYFVLGAIASGMLLYGISLVYGFTGSTRFADLAPYLSGQDTVLPGITIGLVLIIVAFSFKVSAVPFHMWTPDVYQGVPTPVTAFFAVAPKIAALGVFARVLMDPFAALLPDWQQVIVVVSVASMFLGALAAIRQHNIKRLLAYSSIGHMGYALIGIAAGTAGGVGGMVIYLALYLVMNVGTFACVLLMRRRGQLVEDIKDLSGLSRTHPAMAFALAAFMFSMTGIPPLAGFFGKMYIFLAAVEGGLYVLAVLGVLASVIAAYYYLKIVKIMYFDAADEPLDKYAPVSMRVIIAGTTAVVLLFFLYPTPLVTAAMQAAGALGL